MDKGYIICVDDQPAILDSLMTQLETAVGDKCEIETAESADEALELLDELLARGECIEMVISDEVMPGMKGSQLLEVVHQRVPEVLTVMLTGQAGLGAVAYAVNNANLDKYFTKPWQYDDLKLSVHNLLEKTRLRRHNQELTRQLEENYRELNQAYLQLKTTQEQLIHAEKLSVIGQLAGGIAHEVKNQLNMMNFAEIMQRNYPDDEKVQKYTNYILNAGKNIYNLVDEMRRFAKKEERRYEMAPAAVTEVLDKVISFMRFDKLLAKRKLITDFHDHPMACLNEDKFGQVIINLLRNAAHATNPDTGQIRIRVCPNAHHVELQIEDNGGGIPQEYMDRIWDSFFTTKGEEGTGLGLDICRRIVEEHHGTITCHSRQGIGTTFTILLPIAPHETEAVETQSDVPIH